MKKTSLIILAVAMQLTAYSMQISVSKPTDSTYYRISEWKLKEMAKVAADFKACNKQRISDSLIIAGLEKQKTEQKNKADFFEDQNKIEIKKQKRLKWGIGTTAAVLGGLIIYTTIRK